MQFCCKIGKINFAVISFIRISSAKISFLNVNNRMSFFEQVFFNYLVGIFKKFNTVLFSFLFKSFSTLSILEGSEHKFRTWFFDSFSRVTWIISHLQLIAPFKTHTKLVSIATDLPIYLDLLIFIFLVYRDQQKLEPISKFVSSLVQESVKFRSFRNSKLSQVYLTG